MSRCRSLISLRLLFCPLPTCREIQNKNISATESHPTIITALSRLHWFLVISRNSTFVYKSQAVDIRRIGKELDVNYVLAGNVQKAGNRVRINVELVDTKNGVQHWA